MHPKVKEYIEKNVVYYAPTFHIFDVKVDKDGDPDTGDYSSEDDMDRKGHWHNNETTQDFDDWEDLVKDVKRRVF